MRRPADVKAYDVVEVLAERLFYAVLGHTGMEWEQLDDEFGKEGWRRKVCRMTEALYSVENPVVVLDLARGELWWSDDK